VTNVPNNPFDDAEASLNALSEAISTMTAELSLDHVLHRLAEITAHLVKARYAALGVPNEEGGLQNFFTYGMTEQQISHMDHLPLGLGLLGLLIARPEPIRLEDMHADERSAGFPQHHPQMTSFLGVPIISKGKHLGSLYLCDRLDGKPFTEEDERMVGLLAGHAAIAIENAKLLEQLRKLAVIEERDRISMELHDGIIQAIYAIGIKLELTRLRLDKKAEAEAQIISANHDLNQVIEDLRKYIQDLHLGVNFSVELQDQIGEIAEGFRQVSSARLVMDVASGFTQLNDARLHGLLQVIREALSNIVRHANASEVYVDLHETTKELTLVISDNGQGFPTNQPSNGNGLHNIRQRVRQLDGSIDLMSQPGHGTTLTISLPI
jgi:signal transduction histidine kinase